MCLLTLPRPPYILGGAARGRPYISTPPAPSYLSLCCSLFIETRPLSSQKHEQQILYLLKTDRPMRTLAQYTSMCRRQTYCYVRIIHVFSLFFGIARTFSNEASKYESI